MRKLLCIFSLLFACSIDVRESRDLSSGGGAEELSESSSEETSVGDSSSSEIEEESSEATTESLRLDVGTPPDITPADRCDKIDFLFVIDNSGSMSDNQDTLIENIPDFVDGLLALEQVEELSDYHVGVVTTDNYASNVIGCQSIGSLVVQTDTEVCGPYADGNFMTKNDDIIEKFSCAAKVGIKGDGTERPLSAVINAAEEWLNLPGNCNAGFVRDDAILVVIIIADEDDYSGANIQDLVDHIVWLKNGEILDIVMTAIVNVQPNNCFNNWDTEAARILEFLYNFPYHETAAICEEDYSQFFTNLVNTTINSCNYQGLPK